VRANDVEVSVLGTVFSVEASAEATLVSVDRGRVRVVAPSRQIELAAGDQVRIVRGAEPRPPPTAAEPVVNPSPAQTGPSPTAGSEPSVETQTQEDPVEELLEAADRARAQGQSERALSALRSVVSRHARDPRAHTAWFTIGRLEQGRGDMRAAALAFNKAHSRGAQGSLAEDALAQEALAWGAAGEAERARQVADQYRHLYPNGTHRRRLESVAR
jgi:TolA-binding protein